MYYRYRMGRRLTGVAKNRGHLTGGAIDRGRLTWNQFKQVLCDGLWVDFDEVFSAFFRMDCFFQMHYIVLIFVARRRHNFREIACQKLLKVQKSPEKYVRTTSYR